MLRTAVAAYTRPTGLGGAARQRWASWLAGAPPRAGVAQRVAVVAATPAAAVASAAAGRRAFCAAVEVASKKKAAGSFGSRLRSFLAGFAVAGTLSGYALYFKVQWASEELGAMVREAAARQAAIERRLVALEKR
mmetsp:Transcript_4855/g.9915  ORF Transcript_4855/g.9915 Transcript_4855/m.9915 type:complete len:135 (-) Transcript_4855:98-502(-)